jgi:hypothetical protein
MMKSKVQRARRLKRISAWVVSADMGYGHQRAVFPLKDIAEGGFITVGKNDGSNTKEQKSWKRLLNTYESISRARGIPFVGKLIFATFDTLAHIPDFYPIRNLSRSTFQVDLLETTIKNGLCNGMMEKISTKQLPLITSYFAASIAADMHGYEPVFCIICDADINRVWVAKRPWESSINYFAPCGKAAQRLRSYGVPEERIFLTGFPLPLDLLGNKLATVKSDVGQRLHYLDPNDRFWTNHGKGVEHFLGKKHCTFRNERTLTITYAVGGAGAQKEIGGRIAVSLKERIRNGTVRLNLVAGIRPEVFSYFRDIKTDIGSDNIRVLYADSHDEYFQQFNTTMRETDILWTKPSELSFYVGLGIPIIMTPPIGSQEHFNRQWLYEIHAAVAQKDPDYTHQWLFEMLDDGRIADLAWSGFLKARKLGTKNIMEVLETGKLLRSNSPLDR